MILLAVLTLFALSSVQTKDVDIVTPNGILRGNTQTSQKGKEFNQFLGIQFANITGRFELAIPVEAWKGVKHATKYGPRCDFNDNLFDENCLFLNVFSRSVRNDLTKLPVVVYIHGGSFKANSNQEFGPNYLMNKNLVLVIIQYRLQMLGFLSTGDEVVPGNNGLKDQVMALRWVQQNIESFGGDKDKVTIMGQSAGGASVTYHLVSPMSRGLFHHAIAQSGTFLDPWSITRSPKIYAERLARELNCSISSSNDISQCLKKVPLKDLIDRCRIRKITIKWHADPLAAFGPVLEPCQGQAETTFLNTSPYELLRDGKVAKVPLLTGVTKEEGVYLWAYYIMYLSEKKPCDEPGNSTFPWLHDIQTNWSYVAPATFYLDETVKQKDREVVSNEIRQFYFGNEKIDESTFYNLSHVYSDRLFVNSVQKFIKMYANHAVVYPYLYTFNKYWGLEFGQENFSQRIEATHAAELDMLFSPLFGESRDKPDHNALSESIVNLWDSFIRYGVPNATYGSAKNFPAADKSPDSELIWYQLDSDTSLMHNIFKERFDFWSNLPVNDTDYYGPIKDDSGSKSIHTGMVSLKFFKLIVLVGIFVNVV